jgi:signal transduction histidine kinase
MLGRLQESMDLQRDFVANVSHELRTPLTSIEGFSLALLEGVAQSEEKRQRYLRIIIDESRRLVRILNDLLTLSRLDAGEFNLNPATIDLAEMLENLRERFLSAAREKGIELTVDAAPGLTSIVADRDRLEQVLINLVDNALKYSAGGRVSVHVRVPGPGRVLFEVSDSGPGIPPEDLPRIFDRFFRVERSRSQQYGGSGLGLAICKQLVDAMGGSISAESRLGEGSVFRVELPA